MKTPCKDAARLGVFTLFGLTACAVASDYPTTILSQNPIGYYRLNELTQPPANVGLYATNKGSLGAAADGTYEASPITGMVGPFTGSKAVSFNGVSQAITTPASAELNTTNFSFEVWLKPAEVPLFSYAASSVNMASPRSGWYVAQDDGATFNHGSAFVVRLFGLNGATAIADDVYVPVTVPNEWVHLVLTYDNTTKTVAFYRNGELASSATATMDYVPNLSGAPLTVGSRSDGGFPWPGDAAYCAVYGAALNATRVAAHYAAATSPSAYTAAVMADAPLLYQDYEAPTAPVTANLGSLGSAADGLFLSGSQAGVIGPRPPVYPGFGTTNTAAAFAGDGGAVRLGAFNLNTNTVTISAWVKAADVQNVGAGIIVAPGGGLIIDGVYGGYGLGYYWNNDAFPYNWSPSMDAGLPALPEADWAFAALVVAPDEATIYIGLTNNGAVIFEGTSLLFNHVNMAFSGPTLVGSDSGDPDFSFNGAIDEVAIFKRSLKKGELFTQLAAAIGSQSPQIFTDLEGPAESVAEGDSIVLSVDAGGTPDLTFFWQKDAGGTFATTHSGELTLDDTTLADSGLYSVTISNEFGVVDSQPVYVSVVVASEPQIVSTQGFFDRTLYVTGTLHLAVSATGGGVKFQWAKDGNPIPGATASAFTIEHLAAGDGGNYSVTATNTVGETAYGPVTITVIDPEPDSYEAAIVGSGPEAWWRLNEPQNSIALLDSLGRHDGFYTNFLGGELPTMGVPGALLDNPDTAVTFDASGGVGVIPFSPKFYPSKFCIEIWTKTTDLNQLGVPISDADANGGLAWLANAGVWNGYSPSENAVAPLDDEPEYGAEIAPGIWTHLVIAYDDSVIIDGDVYPYRYWVNGANAGFVWGGAGPNTSGPLVIGGISPQTDPSLFVSRLFNGQVDEVALYPRLLTAAEITNHMTARGLELIAPTFTLAPISQTVAVGKTVDFVGKAVGSPLPLAYQWFKDGTALPDETENFLTLDNVSVSDSGNYTLGVSNAAGSNTVSASLTVIPVTGYANVTNDLVLHLRFDGDFTDASGRENHGVPSDPAPSFVAGVVGAQAAEFITDTEAPFSASYVTLGTVGSGPPTDLQFGATASFSVAMWIKTPVDGEPGDVPFIGTQTNAANNPGWFFGPSYQAGGWQWNLNDGVNNFGVEGPDASINDGEWHSFIVTVDRTTAQVNTYLDGLRVSTRSISGLGNIDNGNYWPAVIGQDPTLTYPEDAQYSLDDLGIWRRALTPAEVANIEAAGRAGHSFDTTALVLTFSVDHGNITINYPSGTLQQSDSLGATASWSTVIGASAPSYTAPMSGTAKFYRVLIE